ncbi:MAG: hypothetical protein JNL30_00055 [Rubrivivax sp.]|nr:hypothetical protein [Rubrivivax sp.]
MCANVAFIAYGAGAGLLPVLTLHLSLAPVNLWRLRQLTERDAAPRAIGTPGR